VGTCLGIGLSSRQRRLSQQHVEDNQLGRLQRKTIMNLETGAVAKLRELIAEEGNPNLMLRVFVQGGGCSGFQYGFTFEEVKNEDDFDFAYDEVRVVVDSMSLQYLNGASIDYREDLQGASFVINNPQAASTCGCGSSFSV
jgi:iron-sulfur cluster insertion protein